MKIHLRILGYIYLSTILHLRNCHNLGFYLPAVEKDNLLLTRIIFSTIFALQLLTMMFFILTNIDLLILSDSQRRIVIFMELTEK